MRSAASRKRHERTAKRKTKRLTRERDKAHAKRGEMQSASEIASVTRNEAVQRGWTKVLKAEGFGCSARTVSVVLALRFNVLYMRR